MKSRPLFIGCIVKSIGIVFRRAPSTVCVSSPVTSVLIAENAIGALGVAERGDVSQLDGSGEPEGEDCAGIGVDLRYGHGFEAGALEAQVEPADAGEEGGVGEARGPRRLRR